MIAIYPGSFDPVTNGHLDIIQRARKFTTHLVVAILDNPNKEGLFTVEERVNHLKFITKDMDDVTIDSFKGLLVEFAKGYDAKLVIRGLRALTDFEYEFQMALTNRQLSDSLETILIPTSLQQLFISSSVVKEVIRYGGDISEMVPEHIELELKKKLK